MLRPGPYNPFMVTSRRGEQFRPDRRTEHAIQTVCQLLKPLPVLLVLSFRGLLLWILVPLGLTAWLLGSPWFLLKEVSPGKFLGWLDFNLGIALLRGPLRPFVAQSGVTWIPVSKMHQIEHRIGPLDLW